jgi:hypothetical protein
MTILATGTFGWIGGWAVKRLLAASPDDAPESRAGRPAVSAWS